MTPFPDADLPNATPSQPPVHIWSISLSGSAAVTSWEGILSRDEVERVQRLQSSGARRRFVAARLAVRHILAGYLDCAAEQLRFRYGAFGKPRLAEPAAGRDFAFSLAYAHDAAALAVTERPGVGVDLEATADWYAGGERVQPLRLGRRELLWLSAQTPARQASYHARRWVLREAWMKAAGQGYAASVESVEVILPEMRPAMSMATGGGALLESGRRPLRDWFVAEPDFGEGWTLGLVAPGPPGPVLLRTYDAALVEQQHAAVPHRGPQCATRQNVGEIMQAKHQA